MGWEGGNERGDQRRVLGKKGWAQRGKWRARVTDLSKIENKSPVFLIGTN